MYNPQEVEHSILDFWKKNKIFEKLVKKNQKNKPWSFIDGPITANNPMGVHHAWGRTYKDIFQRWKAMQGFQQRYQNGFDCQGLWVEVEVEKELGFRSKKDIETYGVANFVNKCKERVIKYSTIQTEQSKRLGYFMDWDNSYFTMSDENNYAIWHFLKECHKQGLLYRGKDAVPWCPRCGTSISQHEILTEEYKELTHESVYFKLPIRDREKEYLLAWTTTPWTIPSNVAVAVNKKEKYSAYRIGHETFWLMDKRINPLEEEKILQGGKKGESLLGEKLIGWEYGAPFDDIPLVKQTLGDYVHRVIDGEEIVTEEEGTGLLHVAPGAGEEDFKLGKENKLPVISSIEEDASYVKDMGEFAGKNAKLHPELIIDFLKIIVAVSIVNLNKIKK